MPVLEVSSDDQYLVASADTTLLEIYAALPAGLLPPFPPVELPAGIGGLIERGGFAQTFFFASEILGAVLGTPDGLRVKIGGRVVKNVQGYDLVRPLVGSFGALGDTLEVTLRLRPGQSSGIQVREGVSEHQLIGSRFWWRDGLLTYAVGHGSPADLEGWLERFSGAAVQNLDYRPRFAAGMGVQTALEPPELTDQRCGWINSASKPLIPKIFQRLVMNRE